jgi:nitric oxide dioxygenase
MALTQEQIDIVKSTVPIIREHGNTVTTTFYRNMLSAHPELKNYFSLRNQQTGAQQAALAKSVLAYATYIDDVGKLTHAVERIAQKHASLFIKAEHYDIVGEHLIGAFGEVLGSGLTPEVKEAWTAAYGQLADIFIQREKQLYQESGEWQTWRKFRIVEKSMENDGVANFSLEPIDGKPLPVYLPGQYVSVQIPVPPLDLVQSRQFSLSEAPVAGMTHYRISVKREETVEGASWEDLAGGKVPGLISNLLHRDYTIGDQVELSPPHGEFYLDPKTESEKPLVLLSAGVGAAPLLSILQTVTSSKVSRPVKWIHTARSSGTLCYAKEVREAVAKYPNVEASIFIKEAKDGDRKGTDYDFLGRMINERLEEHKLLPLTNGEAEYYMCGPEEWMVELRNWLEGKGVDRQRQHLELFKTGDVE